MYNYKQYSKDKKDFNKKFNLERCFHCDGELTLRTYNDKNIARAVKNNSYYYKRWKACKNCKAIFFDGSSITFPLKEMESKYKNGLLDI